MDKFPLRRFLNKTRRKVASKCYLDIHNDIHRCSAFISGAGRSGTTWLGEIIASQLSCRIIFEPFYAEVLRDFGVSPLAYIHPRAQNEAWLSYCRKVVSGRIRHGWTDRHVNHMFPKYRIIKEVRASPFLKWFSNNFPTVPILFIIRHPCAVVLSRMQLSRIEDGWEPERDIDFFLAQRELVEGFLADKLDIIKNAHTVEERHAVCWCISNLLPLKQFAHNELNVLFYENLCTRPDTEIPKIFQIIKHQYNSSVFNYVGQPALTTTQRSAIKTGEDKIARWRTELSREQIKNITRIVRAFALDYLYGDSLTPLSYDPPRESARDKGICL
jgi:hypothetical protein